MFSNGGYFRGVSCPFFASGLCERPYCHFRHVKTEEERITGKNGSSYVESLSEKSWLNPTGSFNSTCENANGQGIRINKYTGKPEPVTGPEEYRIPQSHTTSAQYDINGVNINKYTGQPIKSTKPEEYHVEGSGYGKTRAIGLEEYHIPGSGYGGPNGKLPQQEEYEIHGSGYGCNTGKQRSNKIEEYSVEGSGYGESINSNVIEEYQVDGEGYGKYKDKMKKLNESKHCSAKHESKSKACPEYNPTPINKLKVGGDSAKYTTEEAPISCSDQEYDPLQNFSTGLGLNLHRSGPVKRTYSYDPTKPNFGCPRKKAKVGKNHVGLPKFGDSESEDDGEIGAFSEEEEEEVKEEETAETEGEDDNSDDVDTPAMITDVKVFESLLMDSKDLKEDKKKLLSTDAENDKKSESSECDKNSENVTSKARSQEDVSQKCAKSKVDGSHSRDRGIFKALAKLSDTMSKMKKSDLFCKNLMMKDSSSSTSLNKEDSTSHSKNDKVSSSKAEQKQKSSNKDKSSSKHKSYKGKTSSSSSSSSKGKSSSKEKPSSLKEKSSLKDKSSSKSISNSECSSSTSTEHGASSKHQSSSSHSKHKFSSSSSHSSSSTHKEKYHKHRPEDKNHRHHKSSGSVKHHSNEKHSEIVKSGKDASLSSSSQRQSLSDTSKSTEKKSNNQGRRDSSDSSHSRRSSLDKQKIVDLNVNLFGEDSDNEADEVGVMSEFSDDSDLVGDEDVEAEDPYEECLKIFKENATKLNYSAKKSFTKKFEKKEETPVVVGKRRTAHKTDVEVKRKVPEKPFSKLSPAQVMHNRFLAMQKAALEAERKAEKDKATPSTSASSMDCGGKKRVVQSTLSAACGTRVVDGKTVMATASKSNKRKAHTPNVPNLKRPTIPSEFGSKVPTNVRQRYLNSIIDECLKICSSEEEAFKRGQEEESAVYNRSNSKTIYLNVAINTIKRLRNEASENSPSKAKKPSPMKMSHEAVLGGKNAVRNTYTLNRSGGSIKDIVENFKGAELYKRLERYILKEEQLKENGFPRSDPDDSSKVKLYTESLAQQNSAKLKLHEKICSRCGKRFMVFPNGTYANREECSYHWGKAWKKKSQRSMSLMGICQKVAGAIDTRYTCCQGDLGSEGCQIAQYHVHETNKWENLSGFMKTIPCSPSLDGDYGVYAMDCEMVYTQGGIELARVTVIDQDNASVYETLVRPDRKVIDYNTRFSGITEEDMHDVRTSLRDVQAVLLSLFTDKTILIGHSLESDLCAVKLIHNTVVDTSVVFPHRLGPPYKRALKTLMAEYLKKIIQDDVEGHDSREDAVACMDLMRWRVREDAKKEVRHL